MDMEDVRSLVNPEFIKNFRDRALTPERPVTRGTAETQRLSSRIVRLLTSTMTAFLLSLRSIWVRFPRLPVVNITSLTTMVQRMLKTLSSLWGLLQSPLVRLLTSL